MAEGVGRNYLEGSAGANYLAGRARDFIDNYRAVRGRFGYVPHREMADPTTDPFCIAKGCAEGVRQIYEVLQTPRFASHGGLEKAAAIKAIVATMQREVLEAEYGPSYSGNALPLATSGNSAEGPQKISHTRQSPVGSKK